MSNTIDTKVVEMKFDNKDFETNINSTMTALGKFKQGLNLTGASKGFTDVGNSASSCMNNMSPLGAAAETVGAKFSYLQAIGVGAMIELGQQAVRAGEQIVKSLTIEPVMAGYNMYEKKLSAIQVMMSSTGDDIDTVTKYIKELNEYSNKTIYSFSDMTDNVGKFTNAGVSLETAVTAIKGISNQAALAGANTNECSRAMYNLSQSLATGYMQLIDWKSIENANMATKDFKNALIDTALELGTLEKTADHAGKTAKGNDVTFQSFNSTLSDQWLTTDVLIKTLEVYADETTEVGKKAYDAAQDIKSFSQLMDVLKEEVASGWSDTFELLFGNLEEAKKLWSGVYKVVGSGLQSITDARNNLIKSVSMSKWDQLSEKVAAAGVDVNVFQNALIAAGKKHGLVTDTMIAQMGGFEESLKSGWLTTEVFVDAINSIVDAGKGATDVTGDLTEYLKQFDDVVSKVYAGDFGTGEERIRKLTEAGYDAGLIQAIINDQTYGTATALEHLSDEQLKNIGYTEDQVRALRTLANQALATGTPIDDLIDNMNKPSGGFLMFDSLKNIFTNLIRLATTLRDAFNEVFGGQRISNGIYAILEVFHNLTKDLMLTGKATDTLKRAFKGVFAAIDIFIRLIGIAIKVLSPLGRIVKDVAGIILGIFANIGDEIVALDKFIQKNQTLNDTITAIHDALDKGITKLETFVKTAASKFNFGGFKIFDSFMAGVSKRSEEAGENVTTFGTVLHKIFDPLGTFITNVGKKLGEFGKKFRETFVEGLSSGNFKKTVDLFNSVLGGGILVSIIKFIKGIGESVKDFGGISSVLESVQGCLESYQKTIKADVLKKIATAIAILVGSIFVLSLIDSDKLGSALVAITALFAELMIASAIYTKLTTVDKKSGKKQNSMIGQMIGLAAAVLILSIALKKVSDIGVNDMIKGVVAIAALSAIMVGCMIALSKFAKKGAKGALGMVLFAASIRILASACKSLATLSWTEMAKGLIGVGALMLAVSLFLSNTKFSLKSAVAAAGILVLSVAMKILASACKTFGSMDVNSLIKGLGSIGLLLIALGLFTRLAGDAKRMISTGIGIIAIAAAMKILASAVNDFGSMNMDILSQGLLSIGIALGMLVIAMKLMPTKGMLAAGVGMIALAAGLKIVAGVVDTFGNMEADTLVQGMIGLGGALLILGAASKLMNGLQLAALGLGLTVLSVGLTLMTIPLMLLGSMDPVKLAVALIGLAAALTIIGVAAALLLPVVPAILALSVGLIALGAAIAVVGIGIGLIGLGLQAISVGIGMLVGSVSGGVGIMDMIGGMFTGLVDIIGGLASSFFGAAASVGSSIIEGIGGFLENLGPNVSSFFGGAVETIGGFLGTFFEGAKEVGGQVLQGIGDGLSNLASSIGEFFQNGLQTIKDKFGSFKSTAVEVGTNVINGAKEGLASLVETVSNFFKDAIQTIKDKLTSFKDTAKEVATGAIDGIKDGFSNIVSVVGGFIEDAIQGVKDTFSSWTDIGKNMIEGLKGGIMDAAGGVIDSVVGVASSAIDAVTGFLGIHSPSRVFMKIGRYTDEGFAIGLTRYRTAVVAASRDVAGTAVDTVSDSISKLNDIVSNNIDPNPTIAPVMDLSNVEDGMNTLNGMSCDIGTVSATGRIAADMTERMDAINNPNTTTPQGTNVNFVQNNYSPKALSRMDIYRQTKNQISMVKGIIRA